MISFLKQPKVLWLLFFATVALSVGFQLTAPAAGGVLLDSIGPTELSQKILAGMTQSQKQAHLWITVLLDLPYPFAYGGLFAGLCLRHGGRYALLFALPAFAVVPIDLVENGIQIIALLGNESLLAAKTILTPAKIILFVIAALLALLCSSFALVLKFFRRPA